MVDRTVLNTLDSKKRKVKFLIMDMCCYEENFLIRTTIFKGKENHINKMMKLIEGLLFNLKNSLRRSHGSWMPIREVKFNVRK